MKKSICNRIISCIMVISLCLVHFPLQVCGQDEATARVSNSSEFISAINNANVKTIVVTETISNAFGRNETGVHFIPGGKTIKGEGHVHISISGTIQLAGDDVVFDNIGLVIEDRSNCTIYMAGHSMTLNNVRTRDNATNNNENATEDNKYPVTIYGGSQINHHSNVGQAAKLTVTGDCSELDINAIVLGLSSERTKGYTDNWSSYSASSDLWDEYTGRASVSIPSDLTTAVGIDCGDSEAGSIYISKTVSSSGNNIKNRKFYGNTTSVLHLDNVHLLQERTEIYDFDFYGNVILENNARLKPTGTEIHLQSLSMDESSIFDCLNIKNENASDNILQINEIDSANGTIHMLAGDSLQIENAAGKTFLKIYESRLAADSQTGIPVAGKAYVSARGTIENTNAFAFSDKHSGFSLEYTDNSWISKAVVVEVQLDDGEPVTYGTISEAVESFKDKADGTVTLKLLNYAEFKEGGDFAPKCDVVLNLNTNYLSLNNTNIVIHEGVSFTVNNLLEAEIGGISYEEDSSFQAINLSGGNLIWNGGSSYVDIYLGSDSTLEINDGDYFWYIKKENNSIVKLKRGLAFEDYDGNQIIGDWDFLEDVSLIEVYVEPEPDPVTGTLIPDSTKPVYGTTISVSHEGTGEILSYAWYRDGQEIEHATTAYYTPDKADVGSELSVKAFGEQESFIEAKVGVVSKVKLEVVSLPTIHNKVYDESLNAEISNKGLLSGAVFGDEICWTVTARFQNKDAGENKKVDIFYTLATEWDTYYSIPTGKFITGQISKANQQLIGTTSYNMKEEERVFSLDVKKTTGDGSLSYSSSDTKVVTVDNTGKVTITGPGTAWIVVSVSETDNYNPCSMDVYVVVEEKEVVLKNIGDCKITLNTGKGYTYNGKERKPSVTIMDGEKKLKEGVDYSLSYKNNKNAGKKAQVIITGKGLYNGKITKKFTIKQAAQKIKVKDTFTKKYGDKSFSLEAKRTTGNGKLCYSSSDKRIVTVSTKGKVTIKGTGIATITIKASETENYNSKTEKVLIKVSPKKNSIKDISEKKGKKLTVKWAKDTQASGYQIQYSTDRNFKKGVKTITITKNSLTNKTLSGLKANQKYYVRVRAYKNVKINNKTQKLYGSWSSMKKTKAIKK